MNREKQKEINNLYEKIAKSRKRKKEINEELPELYKYLDIIKGRGLKK